MNADPKGYYALLDLEPGASRDAIHAAFRRKARVLHPDIPVTGNANAFVAVKQAYDVLADPLERAAYDRSARTMAVHAAAEEGARHWPSAYDEAEEIPPEPPPPMPLVKLRTPRWTDLPVLLWASLGGLALLAGMEAVLHFQSAAPKSEIHAAIPATAPSVTPAAPAPPPTPIRLAGTPNAYVLPAGGAAVVWRFDPEHSAYVPRGHLPPFSAVQVIRVLRENGLVEIQLGDDESGFIDASRLTPGNVAAARQSFCTYNAGPAPANAEVLQRSGSGPASLTLINHSGQPAVVKLRTMQGQSAATVYLAPDGQARVDGLPEASYRPDYAIGELWSRTCNIFAAGMRAQRFTDFMDVAALSPLTIPPDLSGGRLPVDIPDTEFSKP